MESPFNELPEVPTRTNGRSSQNPFGFEIKSPFINAESPSYESSYQSEDHYETMESSPQEELEDMVDEEEYEIDFEEENSPPVISSEVPMPVPVSNPIAFAPEPPQGSYWPVATSHAKGREVAYQGIDKKTVGNSARRFLATRPDGGRYHCAVDLYANHKDPVIACEDGKIVNFYHFYRGTYALLVEHSQVVINYGELDKDSLTINHLKIGDPVKAGQVIARIGRMHNSSMLHFETYRKGTRNNKRFSQGSTPPPELLNPTKYLLFLQQYGLSATGAPKLSGGSISTSPPTSTPPKFMSTWSKAIEWNRKYGKELGWNKHIYEINEFLLKIIGKSNVSLGEEALAEAVAEWQRKSGFTGKNVDGVLGPNSWKKMKGQLGLASTTITTTHSAGIESKTVARVQRYSEIIDRVSKQYGLNPNIARGIIAAESDGDPNSGKGKPGYKGLMQASRDEDQLDPETSIKTGVTHYLDFRDKYLGPQIAKLGIDKTAIGEEAFMRLVLSSYNSGQVTVLKAIQYAKEEGDWKNWLAPVHYQRALLFSGGYAKYDSCNKNASSSDLDKANQDAANYKMKKGKSLSSQTDPPKWEEVSKIISPVLRCWIETRYRSTPGYLDRIVNYYKYFEAMPVTHESYTEEVEHEMNYYHQPEEYFEEERTGDEMYYEEEMVGEEETDIGETTDELTLNDMRVQEIADREVEERSALGETETDEYRDEVDMFSAEDFRSESVQGELEGEIDHEEWEEDSSETARIESNYFTMEQENGAGGGGLVSPSDFSKWFSAESSKVIRFPAEPMRNLDQLPIPPWIRPDDFYKEFLQKHNGDAKTIIGDSSQKVKAKYFVLHDTAVTAEFTPSRIKGKFIHMWLNAKSPVLLGLDWHIKGLGVKLERSRNNSFVHVEITRDKDLQNAVKLKTKGKKVSAEEFKKAGGVKSIGTYYTDKQYELLAYAYLVASIRKGSFLTITMHREVDRSVVVTRKNGEIGYGHDDPQFFDLDYFYGIVCRLLRIEGTYTFGIQTDRSLAHKQGNMAGYINAFVPYVTGDAPAANQYGELMKLDPKTSKYKIVARKYGNYYDATGLKNKLQQSEFYEEMESEAFSGAPVSMLSEANTGAAPQLIYEEPGGPGYTIYANISIGRANYPLIMTGIYAPASFNPSQPTDVIIFLHGMTGTFPGECSQINDYWTATDLPQYNLRIREDVNDSGKNVILVAPTLGKSPNAYTNTLSGKKGGLDAYMEKVLAAINTYVVQKKLKASSFNFRNIILSAHSAGGRQMRLIATTDNPVYGNKISECWGFDCMYDSVGVWEAWAKKNPDKKLFVYYLGSTQGNSNILAGSTKKLSNVFIKKSSAKNHYWVPKEHLKDRILKIGRTDLTKTDFEGGIGYETEYNETEMEEFVRDPKKAIRLNAQYGNKLGWNQYLQQISGFLSKASGIRNLHVNDENFAEAVASWQSQQGFSEKESDGVLGPGTWSRMKPFLNLEPAGTITSPGGTIEASEWSSNPNIRAHYPNSEAYKKKRDTVVSWGISSPAAYIESAIQEWNGNTGIHSHFDNNFDGDPHRSYLNLKRLYNARGISNPASYFSSNLVSISFFNRRTPGHKDLGAALAVAQTSLVASGNSFVLDTGTWSFVPRTFNDNIGHLSNHALGKAIDVNPKNNPHIKSKDEILVIDAVCSQVLPNGLLRETNPDVLRNASQHFQSTFNDGWVAQQSRPALVTAITKRRTSLDKYAATGFLNLPSTLVRGLQNAGLSWGGSWRTAKDFMHFELSNP